MYLQPTKVTRCLPPTEDAFSFHLLRALYQLVVYKRAVHSKMHPPPATDFFRCVHNNCLISVLMSKPPKPTIFKVTFCKCSKQRCGIRCSCKKADVPCTAACLCFGKQTQCAHVKDPGAYDDDRIDGIYDDDDTDDSDKDDGDSDDNV